MDQTYMKKQPVLPLLMKMGIPMVISMLVNSLYNIVDSIFVAWISEDAMTALSLVYPIQNLVNAICIGFSVGVNAVIARKLGEGEKEKADLAATQGTLLSFLHGLLLNIICILIMPRFLSMFTDDERLIRYGLQYSNIIFCYAAVIALCLSFEKLFQAVGRMTVSMLCMLVGCIANIILDPLMIFGIGPFPRMGIQGAALATGTGQVLTLIAYLLVYRFSPINVKLSLRYIKPEGRICRDMYSVGIAATLNLALPSLLISALNGILAPFSQLYVLVLGVYYKLQSLLYQTANGLVQGMRPLIAYNYGAKEYKRVRRIYRTALICIVLIMAVGTVLCLAAAADGIVYRERQYQTGGRRCAAYHLFRLCTFCHFRRLGGSAGRLGKGYAVFSDFPSAVYGCHYPGGLHTEPLFGSCGRVACFLDIGDFDGRSGLVYLPEQYRGNQGKRGNIYNRSCTMI